MKRCASTPTKTPLHHHLAAHNFKPADLLQVHAVDSTQGTGPIKIEPLAGSQNDVSDSETAYNKWMIKETVQTP